MFYDRQRWAFREVLYSDRKEARTPGYCCKFISTDGTGFIKTPGVPHCSSAAGVAVISANLLSMLQYGFRPGHSTEIAAVLQVLHVLYAFMLLISAIELG